MIVRDIARICSLTLGLAATAVACGGATAGQTGVDAGSDATPHVPGDTDATPGPIHNPPPAPPPLPSVHRPAPLACGHVRAPSTPGPAGQDAGFATGCATDADCTHGTNGRCQRPGGNAAGMICSYDECFADTDCGAGSVCDCGVSANGGPRTGANVCTKGDCAVDANCEPAGYCSPSASSGGCARLPDAFYCHTPNDTCLDSSDCATQNGPSDCAFDTTAGHWACTPVLACAG